MNPILVEFPMRIETERLYIQPCLPGDGKIVYEAIQASKNELKPWLHFVNKDQTVVEIEEGVRRSYAKFILREDFRLHIFRKEDHVFVGSTGLHRINWDIRMFEIGYWCDSRHHKNGYITEAVEGLTKFAFDTLQANRIEIRCDPLNINSRRIPEKLGFNLEGTLQKSGLGTDGVTLRDTCIYAKVR